LGRGGAPIAPPGLREPVEGGRVERDRRRLDGERIEHQADELRRASARLPPAASVGGALAAGGIAVAAPERPEELGAAATTCRDGPTIEHDGEQLVGGAKLTSGDSLVQGGQELDVAHSLPVGRIAAQEGAPGRSEAPLPVLDALPRWRRLARALPHVPCR